MAVEYQARCRKHDTFSAQKIAELFPDLKIYGGEIKRDDISDGESQGYAWLVCRW
jgi:hypothetical protein